MIRALTAISCTCLLGGCAGDTTDDGDDPVVVDCQEAAPRVRPMRHWTSWQYGRVVQDLLGEALDLSSVLPPSGGAWEGQAGAQSVSPSLVSRWNDAAEDVAAEVVAHDPRRFRTEFEALAPGIGRLHQLAVEPDTTWWSFDTEATPAGGVDTTLEVPRAGEYDLVVRALWTSGWETDAQWPPVLWWTVDGVQLDEVEIEGTFETASELVWSVTLPEGATSATLHVDVRGGIYSAVAIDWFELDGPTDAPFVTDSPARSLWVGCDPRAVGARTCAEEVLTAFVRRAWRRPVASVELDGLLDLVDLATSEGFDFDDGLDLALQAVLLSPSFLFHYDDVGTQDDVRDATGHELAARLALMAWGSLPDVELLDCADAGGLTADVASSDPCGLSAQVARMLEHPRADAIERDFGRQWLALDVLTAAQRDPERYPDFDAELTASMAAETTAVLARSRTSGAPMIDLMSDTTTVVDDVMAAHYGIAPGEVSMADGRQGLLGHASVLTLTSQPGRTSPVLRGKWVLDRITCEPVDAPPDDIPQLDEEEAEGGDLRALLEQHRRNPGCAGCHDALDPLGLALEGFDAVGLPRTAYSDGTPVDTRGTLTSGEEVDGLASLAAHLAGHPMVEACMVQHLATWALALPADELPDCVLEAAGGSFDDALTHLATSPVTTRVSGGGTP